MEYFAALMLHAYYWQCFSPAWLFVGGDRCVPTPWDTDPFAQDELKDWSTVAGLDDGFLATLFLFFSLSYPYQLNQAIVEKAHVIVPAL